jgi:hypothetical protein
VGWVYVRIFVLPLRGEVVWQTICHTTSLFEKPVCPQQQQQ